MASPFFSSTRHGVVDIHKRRRDVLKRARRFENEREFVLKRVLSPFYYHRTQPHTHTHTHTHTPLAHTFTFDAHDKSRIVVVLVVFSIL